MDTNIIIPLVNCFQALSAESLSLITLFFCCFSIAIALRFWRVAGLYTFNVVAIIAANIHVLKVSQFALFPEPLALGTIIFAATYLVSDILTELYGVKVAQRGVGLAFGAQLLMTVFMLIGLGHAPLPDDSIHGAMALLFMPSVRLLIASLVAFALSQLCDIWVFQRVKTMTGSRWLWLRTLISFLSSAFLDNVIFSALAWHVLAPDPLPWGDIWYRYILGTFGARVLVAFMSMPMIYGARLIYNSMKQEKINV